MNDPRLDSATSWVREVLDAPEATLVSASEDASFRRYLRVVWGGPGRVVMDAPPDKEDCRPFVDVAARLRGAGVHAPEVHAQDLDRGFLLLEDLGDRLYLDRIESGSDPDALYRDAVSALVRMQARCDTEGLPDYDDEAMYAELRLFWDWLLVEHLERDPGEDEARLRELVDWLLPDLRQQPRVFVHRDYHSRNLMVCDDDNPGVLDFQDAVVGPVTYDLVSLFKDCYVAWPRERVLEWVSGYADECDEAAVPLPEPRGSLVRAFDTMGVQRQLKAAGIFCRLYHRDGKAGFLKDIPRTLGYVVEVGRLDDRLGSLGCWIEEEILPGLEAANEAVLSTREANA